MLLLDEGPYKYVNNGSGSSRETVEPGDARLPRDCPNIYVRILHAGAEKGIYAGVSARYAL